MWTVVLDGVTTTTVTAGPVQSGTGLYCYECSEKYSSSFDPANAPCLNNLTQITVRQCSPADKYCQVSASIRYRTAAAATAATDDDDDYNNN